MLWFRFHFFSINKKQTSSHIRRTPHRSPDLDDASVAIRTSDDVHHSFSILFSSNEVANCGLKSFSGNFHALVSQ